jgi:nicotinate-nucleotide adenylyltransferase
MVNAVNAVSAVSEESEARRCILVLGGSFDPVHAGHVALASHFVKLLAPDALRIIPAGNPWQKTPLYATPEQRVAMLQLAFETQPVPLLIDLQEIQRDAPTYTVDTLRTLRAELGPHDAIVFLLGADQLRQLDSWHNWQELFEHAHLCAASRPGFALDASDLPPAVLREFQQRAATPEQLRSSSHGRTFIARNLAVDVSATAIRAALHANDLAPGSGSKLEALLPARVLDYIQQHRLYRN